MSWTRFGSIAVLLALVVPAAAVDIDDLKPGLVAVYRDSAKNPVEIVRLEPAIGLNWKTAESPHPRLAADGGSVAWQGYLNILRAGKYSFAANLRGQVQVTIAGKEVLAGDSKGGAKLLVRGRDTELPSGPQPLSVKFSRAGSGAAQLELLWQASYFRSEPIPYDHLFHDPGKLPARFAVDRAAERGRFFFEEYGCLKCHQADARDQLAAGLQSRIGPDLSQVGGRATPGWLHHWLSDPQLFRPGAAMPRMFADDEAGKVELYAVSRYLASRIGPGGKPPAKPANPKELEAAVKRGRELFGSAGCIACHADKPRSEPAGMYGDPRNYPLGALGNKTTADALAAYLGNPLAIDPSGRMPDMLLNPREALDLAWFLCEVKDNRIPAELPAAPADDRRRAAYQRLRPAADELDAFQKLRPDDQWLALGQRLVIAKGCTNCHNITSAGKPLPVQAAQANFAALRGKPSTAGCLADEPAQRRSAPLFSMNDADRKAIRTFLQEAGSGAGSPAPMHAARLTLHRFNCFACHSRNGKGGLTPQIVEDLRRFEKAENAEAVMPPPLTGVGHKLRTPWLRQVLVQKARARPWMALRMPHFGEANVGQLVEALAYLEGSEPDDQVHQAPLTAASIDAGKHLVGKNAFGCISCHDLAGIPNTGTRGPDLAYMNQRVRYDWYLRWLEQPQKMQPGTRMPTVFPDGKTTIAAVLGGSADAQAEAMWAYLSLGPTLPLPPGLEPNIKGRIVSVTDKPLVLRCFMPEVGARAIAVGYPSGVSIGWDANTCRTVYAWSGNFLDAAPIWNDRGGSPVKTLGTRFWMSPGGHPWALTAGKDPPDFAAQAKDPAWGAGLPDNKIFEGVKQLQFQGYRLDPAGFPTFHYLVAAGGKEPMTVAEKPEPLRSPLAVGVRRTFTLGLPPARTAWFLAGETGGKPRTINGRGAETVIEIAGSAAAPADELLILPQGQQILAMMAAGTPQGSTWLLVKQGSGIRALLQIPGSARAHEVRVVVNVWSPYRNNAELLKELLAGK